MRKVMFALAIVVAIPSVQANAQKGQNFSLGNYGRFHGYTTMPVFCGIAKCGDNWRVPGQVSPEVPAKKKVAK